MGQENVNIFSFAGGELAPSMRGRYDLSVYRNGAQRVQNFIVDVQGQARYRPGFTMVNHTRQNKTGVLLPFQFNDAQAYVLEFTDMKMRIFKDSAVLLQSDSRIISTDTTLDPLTLTLSAAVPSDWATGDEVFISGVEEFIEINNRFFTITLIDSTHISLQDIDGVDIDATDMATWKSSVVAASTTDGTLATAYEDTDTLDGVVLSTGDRILLKDQTSGAENGIYTVNASGAPTRATDMDAASEVAGVLVSVEGGTANADTTWKNTNTGTITLETTALTFKAVYTNSVVSKVFELDTPYRESVDLKKLKIRQTADTAYIVHPDHQPHKLTRTDHDAWTLSTFSRTADPFGVSEQIIANFGIDYPSPDQGFKIAAHGYVTGDAILFTGLPDDSSTDIGFGINGVSVFVTKVNAEAFTLQDINGDAIDLESYDSVNSPSGVVIKRTLMPSALAFYESRLWYGGLVDLPDRFYASRPPIPGGDAGAGDTQYDDFTLGADADHALSFTISDDEVNKILWFTGTDRILVAGTFGSVVKIAGSTEDAAISPTSINVRSLDKTGVEDTSASNRLNTVIYVQRGSRTVISLEFDALNDKFVPIDRTVVADHITKSGVTDTNWQTGRPDIFWATRTDGVLIGLTFQTKEEVFAWHRQTTGLLGADKFLSITAIGRPMDLEQLWVLTERTVNGVTRRFVEYLSDDPEIPERDDFVTGDDNEAADDAVFQKALTTAQRQFINVDFATVYDGSTVSDRTMTPGATTGDAVTFTAAGGTTSQVFTAAYVGREIWKKAVDGVGMGRAVITAILTSDTATCRITQAFDSTDTMAAGNWYLTKSTYYGMEDYKGSTVSVVADGLLHPDVAVSAVGTMTLNYESAVTRIGLKYEGLLIPMPLEVGNGSGAGQTQLKNITEFGFRFLNTLGAEFGTDLYRPEVVPFATMPIIAGDPVPLFSGVKVLPYSDDWKKDKSVFVRQKNPLPCIVQTLVLYGESDER